jgi:hypothetical protein
MAVMIKTYKNDNAPYLPPDTASQNYYYKNTSTEAAKSEDTLYGEAIYKWVDEEAGTKELNTALSDYKVRLIGDDLDTVLATDNNGL